MCLCDQRLAHDYYPRPHRTMVPENPPNLCASSTRYLRLWYTNSARTAQFSFPSPCLATGRFIRRKSPELYQRDATAVPGAPKREIKIFPMARFASVYITYTERGSYLTSKRVIKFKFHPEDICDREIFALQPPLRYYGLFALSMLSSSCPFFIAHVRVDDKSFAVVAALLSSEVLEGSRR